MCELLPRSRPYFPTSCSGTTAATSAAMIGLHDDVFTWWSFGLVQVLSLVSAAGPMTRILIACFPGLSWRCRVSADHMCGDSVPVCLAHVNQRARCCCGRRTSAHGARMRRWAGRPGRHGLALLALVVASLLAGDNDNRPPPCCTRKPDKPAAVITGSNAGPRFHHVTGGGTQPRGQPAICLSVRAKVSR